MTSKEALEKLNNLIWREKHINSERNKIVNDCVNQIKKALERLETLEKSSKDFQDRTFNIINTYKKALEILKPHIKVMESTMVDNKFWLYIGHFRGVEITELEFNLINEVLEYDINNG